VLINDDFHDRQEYSWLARALTVELNFRAMELSWVF
jgi:hypothetical protein